MMIDIMQRAEEIGSKATTQKGAIRFLLKWKKQSPHYRKLLPRPSFSRYGWKRDHENRVSMPKEKRARHDKQFRKQYLSRINRKIKRLVKNPGNYDTAYQTIRDLLQRKEFILGKSFAMPERDWMSTLEARITARSIAKEVHIEDGSWGSDHHEVKVLDVIWEKSDLAAYHAIGPVLALVMDTRTRVYAKSSDFKSSTRSDYYLVGRNENGNAFRHQVSYNCGTVKDAIKWVFGTTDLIARQGDIAVIPSRLKNAVGENTEIKIGGGHSRHIFIGEVYQNGSLHVRSGFLVHTGDQHPPIYIDGSKWVRIVAGKQSEIGNSSKD